jgi:hypothetical protein
VELEVEEYSEPHLRELLYGLGARRREQLATHLYQARGASQFTRQGTRGPEVIYIKGND